MAPDAKDRADPALAGHIRSELLDRLASPLYALVAGLIAFAALGEARTTRQGRGRRDRGSDSRLRRRPHARHRRDDAGGRRAIRGCLRLDGSGRRLSRRLGGDLSASDSGASCRPLGKGPRMIGRTLSLYLAGRFARTVLAAFCVVFALIYAVDLVETAAPFGRRSKATALADGGLVLPAHADGRRTGACRSRCCSAR